ncbi:hypothetical protein V6N11_013055 [Hibiscus sabdariffa]|uniref:Uncharacterized protein n=1 Tax=Hibiscus sabdariffa TaxID=183260 RepID=A0ABR2NCK3_9ROSI
MSNANSEDTVVPNSVSATSLSTYKRDQESHRVDFRVVESSLDSMIGLSDEQVGLVNREMEDGQRVSHLVECETETNMATPIHKNMPGLTTLEKKVFQSEWINHNGAYRRVLPKNVRGRCE